MHEDEDEGDDGYAECSKAYWCARTSRNEAITDDLTTEDVPDDTAMPCENMSSFEFAAHEAALL